MPDVPDRNAREARLARELARVSAGRRRKLLAILGDPPDLNRVTPEFWAELEEEVRRGLADGLLAVYLLMAEDLPIDWSRYPRERVIDAAARYAAERAGQVAKSYSETSRERLEDLLRPRPPPEPAPGELRSPPPPPPRPREVVDRIFTPARGVENVSVTEITGAASAGEVQTLDDYVAVTGLVATSVWQTERDPRVCPICRPLHGKRREVWREAFPMGPPAHPGCRCYLEHRLVRD